MRPPSKTVEQEFQYRTLRFAIAPKHQQKIGFLRLMDMLEIEDLDEDSAKKALNIAVYFLRLDYIETQERSLTAYG